MIRYEISSFLLANSPVERCRSDRLDAKRSNLYSFAFLQAVWTPKFKDWRSSSIALSQIALGRPVQASPNRQVV